MISKRVQDGIAAIKAKDFGVFDGFVSKSFSSFAVGDKASLLEFLKAANSMGEVDGVEIDLSKAKTTVTGAKATLGPVTASGSFGSLTVAFEGIKENGVWMITNVEPL